MVSFGRWSCVGGVRWLFVRGCCWLFRVGAVVRGVAVLFLPCGA